MPGGAIRRGDWKLIEGSGDGDYPRDEYGRIDIATRTPTRDPDSGRFVELDYFDLPAAAGVQLYDLSADPGEQKDVSNDHPEIVEQLRKLLDRYRSSGRSR